MQTAVLVVLGVFLCGVYGEEEQFSPDLLSIVRTLRDLQTKVQTLENGQTQQQNRVVAFFAGFHTVNENHGPFSAASTIKYNTVKTNAGNGYNTDTGIFTAPVKGMYVFHVTVFGSFDAAKTVARLKKNTEDLAFVSEGGPADPQDSSTRVAVVTLEIGDTVFVELPARSFFYSQYGLNSFSGFLLSPM